MDGREDNYIKKKLRSLDFSKNDSGFKERLRRELMERSRELSDDELDHVSAAGVPDTPKPKI